MKNYLFIASYTFSLPIMRPLQKVIRERGDNVAWFFEDPALSRFLRGDEQELRTEEQVMEYNPIAVFTTAHHMFYTFPGIKVQLFHGFGNNKRAQRIDDHLRIRGWFDLYCTHGEPTTSSYERYAKKLGYFSVVETGWTKIDGFYSDSGKIEMPKNSRPTILYSSTFTEGITSTRVLYNTIERLIKRDDWNWLITLHPKMAEDTVARYRALGERYDNVHFYEGDNNVELLQRADVMVCDSSSIIIEFLIMDKPVVTFKNTQPGDYLIDIDDPELLEGSIELALTRPEELMTNIRAYVDGMHPFYDGRTSYRVMEAVDALLAGEFGKLKSKPRNWIRKRKMRKMMENRREQLKTVQD